ncbi:hypothetical protein TNCV_3725381 [Trichonephila clavipes]|nr:hypothetical protein TNCV_3725381 [Trichonephila clavipes]
MHVKHVTAQSPPNGAVGDGDVHTNDRDFHKPRPSESEPLSEPKSHRKNFLTVNAIIMMTAPLVSFLRRVGRGEGKLSSKMASGPKEKRSVHESMDVTIVPKRKFKFVFLFSEKG